MTPSLPCRKPLGRAGPQAAARDGLWAIVLAGGEGVRLRPLIRLVHGDDRPKQFGRLLDGRSLVRTTLDRVAGAIPAERTVIVTHRRHERYVADEFGEAGVPHLLRQPEDRGTAAGILAPVHWISWRDPDAVVTVFPSDHFILGEEAFLRHVLSVAAFARLHRDRLVVVGATPTSLETQYGWIQPGKRIEAIREEPVFEVARFWEKPDAQTVRACWAGGGLWNTFVLAGTVQAFLAMGGQAVPALDERLARIRAFAGTAEEPWAFHQAYALAPAANFSRAVLERCLPGLAVARLPACVTWSDWGTPARVIESLRAAGLEPPWLARLPHVLPVVAS